MEQKTKSQTIRPFTRELRKQGFEFCYCDRAGGDKVTEFAKRQSDRTVRVQFWQSGLYRVSHGTHDKLDSGHEGSSETTPPAEFKTVAEMLDVVAAEWTRPSGIPGGIYWSREHGNFYAANCHAGMGVAFHARWKDRKDEFPAR